MVDGYRIIAKESGTISTSEKLFDDDVTVTDTPANYARSIQVSIFTNSSSVLSTLLTIQLMRLTTEPISKVQ